MGIRRLAESGVRRMRVALLGVALAMALFGCGDSGTTPAPSPTPMPGTRAGFIARADRECESAHRQLDSRPAPKTLPEAVAYLDTTIRVNGDLERKLRGLTPPPEDLDRISVILDDFQALIDKATQARQAAAAGDIAATDRQTTELGKLVSVVSVKVRDYGFKVCGIPSAAPVAITPTT